MQKPIGIFDSGIGGITVLKQLKKLLPNEQFIYLGDSARLPYGTKGSSTILRYAQEAANYLQKQDIKMLIIACNTASSVATQFLQEHSNCPVIGTIEPVVESLAAQNAKNILVTGTRATVLSAAFDRAIHSKIPQAQVKSVACPLFVPLVEEGIFNGPIVEQVIDLYLRNLKAEISNFDSLVLGCTHYPLLKSAISDYFENKIEIIECGQSIAQTAYKILSDNKQLAQSQKTADVYYVTDAPERFNILASLFMGLESIESYKIDLV